MGVYLSSVLTSHSTPDSEIVASPLMKCLLFPLSNFPICFRVFLVHSGLSMVRREIGGRLSGSGGVDRRVLVDGGGVLEVPSALSNLPLWCLWYLSGANLGGSKMIWIPSYLIKFFRVVEKGYWAPYPGTGYYWWGLWRIYCPLRGRG